ncbi:fha domain-containing protein [Leptolyngbya sp. Heron Island J]|uniref:hypothetical protein n=1 Tax=Leptolyngbya sp. Heron Island J TaxID=1385935 RepID=UPI0003B9B25D|nr:hypothetical protein [Leptolyngbya sp. Heron Island J]ESA34665.1 fha domain-containing protein [Leptolyngbya sp. Heron Island J]
MAACFIGTVSIIGFSESALANADRPVLLDMPIYSRLSSDDLVNQAESMVSQEIDLYFGTNPNHAEVEIVVLGNRNGDIIPILTTTVSRTQWQENPQVSAWTEYYSSYALIRRHDSQPTQVAARPSRRSTTAASRDLSAQFDQQFDSGQLSGRIVRSYLDLVD